MNARKTIVLTFVAAALAACADDPAGPRVPSGSEPTDVELQAVALEIDVLSASLVEGEVQSDDALREGPGPGPGEANGETHRAWTRTRACPMGGEVSAEGELVRTWTRETAHFESELGATVRHMGCTFEVGGQRFTVEGDPGIEIRAHLELSDGEPAGLQWMHQVGAFTWRRGDGAGGTCQVDVTTELDPAARTRTMSGELCGRTFTHRWEWAWGEDGVS